MAGTACNRSTGVGTIARWMSASETTTSYTLTSRASWRIPMPVDALPWWVEVGDQHPEPDVGERGAEAHGRRALPDPALLIRDRDDAGLPGLVGDERPLLARGPLRLGGGGCAAVPRRSHRGGRRRSGRCSGTPCSPSGHDNDGPAAFKGRLADVLHACSRRHLREVERGAPPSRPAASTAARIGAATAHVPVAPANPRAVQRSKLASGSPRTGWGHGHVAETEALDGQLQERPLPSRVSERVTSSPGSATASGIPGSPAPDPRSHTVGLGRDRQAEPVRDMSLPVDRRVGRRDHPLRVAVTRQAELLELLQEVGSPR